MFTLELATQATLVYLVGGSGIGQTLSKDESKIGGGC